MRRRWQRWMVLSAAAAGLVSVTMTTGGASQLTAAAGVGCDSSRAATVFTGNGAVVRSAPEVNPCLTTTGFGGSETRVVVTADGTIVYEPAIITPGIAGTGFLAGAPGPHLSTQVSPGGLATSHDQATTWSFVEPANQTWVPQDDQLYADRATGWLYYYALSPNPVPQAGTPLQDQLPAGYAQLMSSPDDGHTWYHSALAGFIESENPRFTSAPAPNNEPAPVRYIAHPQVVYWCGNNVLFVPSFGGPSYRACYRSLDGGVSWQFASILFSMPVPQHSQCGTNAESFNAGDGNYPEGAPDGSLYVLVACGSNTYLARSTDEGATWPIIANADGSPRTVPANGELRVDPKGNLYLVAQNGDALDLWTSVDQGQSWQGPANMTIPGSKSVNEWYMAEAGVGEVAVSYVADTASGVGLDGFVSVTQDALAQSPQFFGTTLDDPAVPVYAGSPPQARDDFIGVDTPRTGRRGCRSSDCVRPPTPIRGASASLAIRRPTSRSWAG